ncbi:MAG: hypothetical protein V4489_04980 [Chlamydiota bacterium]
MLPTDPEKSTFLDELLKVKDKDLPAAIDTRIKIAEKTEIAFNTLYVRRTKSIQGSKYDIQPEYHLQSNILHKILEDKDIKSEAKLAFLEHILEPVEGSGPSSAQIAEKIAKESLENSLKRKKTV